MPNCKPVVLANEEKALDEGRLEMALRRVPGRSSRQYALILRKPWRDVWAALDRWRSEGKAVFVNEGWRPACR